MTRARAARWARLTWQAPDPARLAADLGRWLLVEPAPQPGRQATFSIPLGGSELELVPWLLEGPDDAPHPNGRLVLEPIIRDEGGLALTADRGPVPDSAPAAGGARGSDASAVPLTLAGLAWGTVDLERAAAELGPWLRPLPRPATGTGSDPHLGARTRVYATDGLPGELMILAEPVTEGRLGAALARHGEGPCALYLRASAGLDAWLAAARARRVVVGPRRPGPLGASVVVVGRRAARGAVEGPHILVVERLTGASGSIPGGTISA